ncbi:hypothetical protein PLICRDRAFT_35914 [Plicaturopsis crispa FD-325 SS-3]|nr:hypothetical protein PLICRDRAFT_35914 [Plicaturopsis crispa FD-325 SS-3]
MPADTLAARPNKPNTRSSIRHSLNFHSVSKALVDVMNKSDDKKGQGDEKSAQKKSKESRRMSAIGLTQGGNTLSGASRSSMDASKSPGSRKSSAETPDAKTITRHTRRSSAMPRASDEFGVKAAAQDAASPPAPLPLPRSATLRPRSGAGTTSALPKYRPKSVIIEAAKKPPSPVPTKGRKRPSLTTDDDERDSKMDSKLKVKGTQVKQSPPDKSTRPISPLPQRALKADLTTAIKVTPSTPPKPTGKKASTSPGKPSSKPTKVTKISTPPTPPSRPASNASTIPRPPSSSSTSSSARTPRTPKTPSSLRTALGMGRSARDSGNTTAPSPLRSAIRAPPESPLASHSRKHSKTKTCSPVLETESSSSALDGEDSQDSFEAQDVSMLLAPTAALTEPTPAIPRIQPVRRHPRNQLQTPARGPNFLPNRVDLSYLSPDPPSDGSPSLRPTRRTAGNDRGSILSWEQLADQSAGSLDEGEMDSMLADIPAPFQSGRTSRAVSPTSPLTMDIPESPFLSALPSPGGYGSISQVLLPDVTPSPAPHYHQTQRFDQASQDGPATDAAVVTLLRLQLASADNIARERLERLQSLEEQLHSSKEARIREVEELTKHVSFLQERVQSDVEARERSNEESLAYTASLEDQLRHTQAFRDQAVEAAVAQEREAARVQQQAALKREQLRVKAACLARGASAEWASVRDLAEGELDLVRSSRETLAVLLAGLTQSQRKVC